MVKKDKIATEQRPLRILALETSTEYLGIGVLEEGKLLLEYSASLAKRHSTNLIPFTQGLLHEAGLTLADFSAIAVSLGPGSFTGIRIGLATAQALAFGLDLALVGVPTLDIIAHNVPLSSMPLCVLLDAHRQLVYACIFKRRGQIIKRHSSYLLTGMGELMSRLPSPCLFLGDGLLLYESMLRQQWKGEAHFAPQGLWIPRAGNLAVLAGKKLRQGRDFDPAGLKPLYLYPKECQVKS